MLHAPDRRPTPARGERRGARNGMRRGVRRGVRSQALLRGGRPSLRGPLAMLVVLVVLLVALAWWASAPWRAPDLTYPVTSDELASARAALGALPELTAEPAEPYERSRFGTPWADVDGNGCGTRDDILARDLTDPRTDADGCTVLTGVLVDRYTGHTLPFRRGPTTSARVQVDHVVALADAWRTGAWAWDDPQRLRLANDPANLLAVDGPTNEDKGAQDAATWLPPHQPFRCHYAVLRVRVRTAYGLALAPHERGALERALDACDVAEITVTPGVARH
ncbi:HNH endonuclease family protein [Sanguibacter sp. A247]|uniref:HNH endonuclease family protein n=1 Tax=unclassified Sanguibacter TaxID=2645534 RepID=UPI003FD8D0AF